MQAQANYAEGSAFTTLRTVVKNEGFLALYRGLVPPLIGSTIFRSVQFTAFGFAMGGMQDSSLFTSEVPMTGGMQLRVPVAGIIASTARAITETPLEFIKVRLQTGQSWMLAGTREEALRQPLREVMHAYKGFGITWMRTVGLMTSFFMMVDFLERKHHDWVAIPVIGPFLKGGVCATAGWLIVWPFENLKNQVQANAAGLPAGTGWAARAKWVMENRGGVRGLYRGIGPGLARSLIANGSSMVVFSFCQQCLRSND